MSGVDKQEAQLTEDQFSPICAIGSTLAATVAVCIGGLITGTVLVFALSWLGIQIPDWFFRHYMLVIYVGGFIGFPYLINDFSRRLYPHCRRRYGR